MTWKNIKKKKNSEKHLRKESKNSRNNQDLEELKESSKNDLKSDLGGSQKSDPQLTNKNIPALNIGKSKENTEKNKQEDQEDDFDDDFEADFEDIGEELPNNSSDYINNNQQNNNIYDDQEGLVSSDEMYMSESLGVNFSVNSLALEEFDYVEEVENPDADFEDIEDANN